MIVAPASVCCWRMRSATSEAVEIRHVRVEQDQGEGFPSCAAAQQRLERLRGHHSTAVGFICHPVSDSTKMRRLTALSSTISTGSCRRNVSGCSACGSSPTPNEAVKWNVLPPPASLSTHDPSAHQCRTSVAGRSSSPRPVPPNRRVVDPSAWRNASKIGAVLVRRDADPGVGDA